MTQHFTKVGIILCCEPLLYLFHTRCQTSF